MPRTGFEAGVSSALAVIPNSTDFEFDSHDAWLLVSLKGSNSQYRLNNVKAAVDLPSGSIVLFGFGFHRIIREAAVIRMTTQSKYSEYRPRTKRAGKSVHRNRA